MLDRQADEARRPAVSGDHASGRWHRASAGRRCFIFRPRKRGWAVAVPERPGVRSPKGRRRRHCSSRRRCPATEAAWLWSSGKEETATGNHVGGRHGFAGLAEAIDIQGGKARPTGRRTARGSRQAAAPRRVRHCSRSPWMAVRLFALIAGQAINPVWSPDGNLIVYDGALVPGQVAPLLGVRPDGAPVELPPVRVSSGSQRFLPNGSGLVYLPRNSNQSPDFWLLDLATGKQRQLTRLSNLGTLGTFDMTPDGKHIVFDRSRENSHIVLIERPKQIGRISVRRERADPLQNLHTCRDPSHLRSYFQFSRLPGLDPFDRLRQPPRAGVGALRFRDPLDVLALVAGRERVERRLRLLALLQRGRQDPPAP